LIPAVRITLPHFSISAATCAPNSVGLIVSGAAAVGEACPHAVIGEALVRLAIEPLDDLDGRAFRRAEPHPALRRVAQHGLAHARHIRQRRPARPNSDAENPQSPRSDVLDRRRDRIEHEVDMPGEQIGECRRAAAIRHMEQIDPSHRFEQLAVKMRRAADAGRRHQELAGIGLGIGDQLRDRPDRKRRPHHHDTGAVHHSGDRRDVTKHVEAQVRIEPGAEGVHRGDHEQRMAVCRGADHRFGRKVAAGAGSIFHDEWLPQARREPIGDNARQQIRRAARRGADQELHRPCRVVLRPSLGRDGG
jgi:hypothetical protein